MNEEAAFLDAIRVAPTDDTTRLVYADWLEERGQSARAEFIRAQIEALHASGPQRDALLARCQTLATSHAVDWTGFPVPLAATVFLPSEGFTEPADIPVCYFRRGFVRHVVAEPQHWLAHGDQVIALNPAIELVSLRDAPEAERRQPDGRRLVGRERWWASYRHLRVHEWSPEQGDWDDYTSLRLLEAEWPGIAFQLPGATPAPDQGIPAEAIRSVVEAAVRSAGFIGAEDPEWLSTPAPSGIFIHQHVCPRPALPDDELVNAPMQPRNLPASSGVSAVWMGRCEHCHRTFITCREG